MSQPPYPPPGGNEPGGDQPGSSGWDPPGGADDPTRKFESPAGGFQRDQTQQFGQPGSFGQPPYGQGQPGQPQPGQYGQQPGQYGQPQYGQPQYGQQPGQPQYGQPPYGQPQYGQPWGPGGPGGPGAQGPKSNKNTVIALTVAAVLVLAAIGAGLFFLLRGSGSDPSAAADSPVSASSSAADAPSSESSESSPSSEAPSPEPPSASPTGSDSLPPPTVTPDGLGEDPALDELAQQCYDGNMQACDDLYAQSESDSLYELYGGTCAGRQDVSDSDTVFCTSAFPGN